MKFKNDSNLQVVMAEMSQPKSAEIVANELCGRLVSAGLIDNTPDNHGKTVAFATGSQNVFDVCAVLSDYLYGDKGHSIPSDVFDAFCELTITFTSAPMA